MKPSYYGTVGQWLYRCPSANLPLELRERSVPQPQELGTGTYMLTKLGWSSKCYPSSIWGHPKKAKVAFTHKDPYKKQEIRFGQNEEEKKKHHSLTALFFPENPEKMLGHNNPPSKRETLQKTPRINSFSTQLQLQQEKLPFWLSEFALLETTPRHLVPKMKGLSSNYDFWGASW